MDVNLLVKHAINMSQRTQSVLVIYFIVGAIVRALVAKMEPKKI